MKRFVIVECDDQIGAIWIWKYEGDPQTMIRLGDRSDLSKSAQAVPLFELAPCVPHDVRSALAAIKMLIFNKDSAPKEEPCKSR